MTGERMTRIYTEVCLGKTPQLKTKEERVFYRKLVQEMKEEAKGKPIEWSIPAD